jgi:nucleoside-diphosphate-sugar epimerase
MPETPSEIDVLRAALAAAEARAAAAEEELTQARAVVSASDAMIRHLQLQIAKLRRDQFGHSAERHARLIEQLEMQLEDIETDIADDRAKAEATGPRAMVAAFERAIGRPLPHRIVARRPGDIAESYADPSRAHAELGWSARLGIDDMCADTWRWQSANPQGYPVS